MKAALVVTTYNNPRFLGLCLKSLSRQSCGDFDVFVADDGSRDETGEKIESMRPLFRGRKLERVWHPDDGYRKSTINNEVFRRVLGYEVTICVDHDVILHPEFVGDHLAFHRRVPDACFMGRRVELGPIVSAGIDEGNVLGFCRGLSLPLLASGLRGDSLHVLRAMRIGSPTLRRLLGRDRVPDLLGSNFSVATGLLYRVNGYNEDYRSYWGEDGDLFVRLRNSGATLAGAKCYAIQFHLHHPRLEPDRASQARYRELLGDRSYVRCRNGIARDP